ncbi:hypothetical protein D9M72_617350 [compost metagenome]
MRLSPLRVSSKATTIPAWRTSATCGWSANGAAKVPITEAMPRLRAITSSSWKMSSVANAAAQASGLPV